METRELWHGGRLPQFISEIEPPKSGRLEYGPGLYLTTHYSTARHYAKGSRGTYKIALAKGTPLSKVRVDGEALFRFIETTYAKAKAKALLEYFKNPQNLPTEHAAGKYSLEPLLNLTIAEELLPLTKMGQLTDFFRQAGADYLVSTRYGGRDESIVVVYNPRLIQKVVQTSLSDWLPSWEPDAIRVKQLTEFFQSSK